MEAVNTNGPAYFDEDARFVSQRSALALSLDGDRVYVAFGGYYDEAVGWMTAVDTRSPRITSSFSGASDTLLDGGRISRHANAGMWAPARHQSCFRRWPAPRRRTWLRSAAKLA